MVPLPSGERKGCSGSEKWSMSGAALDPARLGVLTSQPIYLDEVVLAALVIKKPRVSTEGQHSLAIRQPVPSLTRALHGEGQVRRDLFRHLCLLLFEIYRLTSQGTHGPDRAAVLIHHVIDDSASPARGPTHHMSAVSVRNVGAGRCKCRRDW